ncbi:CDP-glycerol glycerophosphotransferase family protein [Sabulilitoribacter arenilitoris]|uniref:CDP-glycerol glycerophosphotransferase family protein n=1 Tax=Wocania arenilitoris TaxID=2044858 RepID=A0AAE3EM60_9FLAO|nr:CDP-glycerol glycerophosphotransferase family protein [Wocania arenilitoris]MCF7566774.1 CDP-glycerol glycerophosphotransferase family protein [Wocania arenilitoris]
MRRILEGLKTIIKIGIGFPVYYISIFFPKRKDLAVIGSSLGRHFADNSKYYYIDYYSKERNDLNLVWVSKNRNVVKELNSKGLPAEFLYSYIGIYITLRASKAYISHQLGDINGALIGGSKIIQLWHGMPLRKIGYGGDWTDKGLSGKIKLFISKWLPYAYYMKCDVLMAPCKKAKDNYVEPFSKSFRNNKIKDNIVLSQQPRTFCFDDTFKLYKNFFPEAEMLLELRNTYKNIISWLPTQRKQFNKTIIDIIKDSGLDLEKMNAFCKNSNSLFVIKVHFLDFNLLNDITQEFKNILIYPYSDPYPLLKFTNVLITDYSSVFFDFLLLNRPIIFMCHDLEEYADKVEFYYDFEGLDIGTICKSWKNTLKVMSNILENKDDFVEKRKQKLKMFNFVLNYDPV